MGTNPTKAADNPFCKARMKAAKYDPRLKSREGAAELLHLSVSTINDYELGNVKTVPPDKVALMAEMYRAPELENYYCKQICPLGDDIPVLNVHELDRIALKTIAELEKAPEAKKTLLKITADGIISTDEKEELNSVIEHLDELSHSALSLKAWLKKNYGWEG